MLLGRDASVDQATIEQMRQKLGVNRPLPIQYLDWLRHVVVGDFGRSYRTRLPVGEAVLARLPVTLELTVIALGLAILIAIPLGLLCALHPNSRLDLGLTSLASIGL